MHILCGLLDSNIKKKKIKIPDKYRNFNLVKLKAVNLSSVVYVKFLQFFFFLPLKALGLLYHTMWVLKYVKVHTESWPYR